MRVVPRWSLQYLDFFKQTSWTLVTFSDVLPDPDCIDFSKPDAVLTLIDYFQSCYDIIGVSTYGNVQNLMYRALSDAIGGYLRGYALPLTKRAYYEGAPRYFLTICYGVDLLNKFFRDIPRSCKIFRS